MLENMCVQTHQALQILPQNIVCFGQKSFAELVPASSVTRKKLPNVYKSCLKMISQEKWLILLPLQKLPKNVGDFGKLIVPKGFQKLPKVQ